MKRQLQARWSEDEAGPPTDCIQSFFVGVRELKTIEASRLLNNFFTRHVFNPFQAVPVSVLKECVASFFFRLPNEMEREPQYEKCCDV